MYFIAATKDSGLDKAVQPVLFISKYVPTFQ